MMLCYNKEKEWGAGTIKPILTTITRAIGSYLVIAIKVISLSFCLFSPSADDGSRNDRRTKWPTWEEPSSRIVPSNKPPLYLSSRSISSDQPSLFPSPS